MNAVELVKEICKERNIPISRLERECGFSNGYISKLKKGYFPIDKAEKIANYLNIDVNILIGVQIPVQHDEYYQDALSALVAQEMFDDRQLRGLHHIKKNIDAKRFKAYYDMITNIYKAENPNDDYDFDNGEQADRPDNE